MREVFGKTNKKMLICCAVLLVLAVASVVALAVRSNIKSGQQVETAQEEADPGEESIEGTDGYKQATVYDEIYDMIEGVESVDEQEKMINEYFGQKFAVADEDEGGVSILAAQSRVLTAIGRTEASDQVLRKALEYTGVKVEAKAEVCDAIFLLASEAESEEWLNRYIATCDEELEDD